MHLLLFRGSGLQGTTVCTVQTTISPDNKQHVIDQYSNERHTYCASVSTWRCQSTKWQSSPPTQLQPPRSASRIQRFHHVAYMYLLTHRHHQHHPLFTSAIRRTYYSFQINTAAMDQRRALLVGQLVATSIHNTRKNELCTNTMVDPFSEQLSWPDAYGFRATLAPSRSYSGPRSGFTVSGTSGLRPRRYVRTYSPTYSRQLNDLCSVSQEARTNAWQRE